MSILNELNYQDSVLPNGLKVLTVDSPHLGLFSAELIIKKGFRDELENQTQWSHLLEHIMGGNCKLFPDQISQDTFLTNKGIRTNAYTDVERIAVWGDCAPEQATPLLEYIFDAVKNPIISQTNIDREAEIINQEHQQMFTSHDAKFSRLTQLSMVSGTTLANILGPDHYQLKKPTVEDLTAFHQRLINGSDMILVVSSSFTHKAVVEMILPFVSDILAGVPKERIPETLTPTKLVTPESTSDSKIIDLKWLGLKKSDPLYPAFRIYNSYLTGNLSAALNKKLRLEKSLTYGVGSGLYSVSDVGLFTIYFKTSRAQEGLDDTREVIKQAWSELQNKDLRTTIKDRIILNNRRALLSEPNDLINWISGYYILEGEIKRIEDSEQELEKVTDEEIKKVLDLLSVDKAYLFCDDPTVK